MSECRICKEPIEPCAKGWHEDVCHYHSLIVGDYLCGSWLQESIAREARALGEQAGAEAGDE